MATSAARSRLRLLPASVLAPAASGLLLFLSDFPAHLWPLQIVALVPVLLWLSAGCRSTPRAALGGLLLGLSFTVPLAVVLEFPLLMGGGLALYLAAVWAAWAALAFRLLRWPPPAGAVAVAAMAAALEWAQVSLVPVWGTAQSFVRVWSAAPEAIQFVAATGMAGLVFAVVAIQALAVTLWRARSRRALTAALLAAVVALPAGFAWGALWEKPDASRRVAVIGWTDADLADRWEALFTRVYLPLFERAVEAGADLVVSPEAAFVAPRGQEDELLARFAELARRHRVDLAVGIFHLTDQDNRIAFFNAQGELTGQYRKTHLIPFLEDYRAGDGTLAFLHAGEDHPIGGMICQDDNFTDLARAYGRAGAALVVVPTNDWRQVKDHHFENSLFRAIENRYAMARAASNGISALVDPKGRVLARADHFEVGPEVLVADVPLGRGLSFYSRAGEWFPLGCLGFLLAGVALRFRRGRREGCGR